MPGSNSELKNAVVTGKNVYLRTPSRRDMKEFLALNRASMELHRGLVSPPIGSPRSGFASKVRSSSRQESFGLVSVGVTSWIVLSFPDKRTIHEITRSLHETASRFMHQEHPSR